MSSVSSRTSTPWGDAGVLDRREPFAGIAVFLEVLAFFLVALLFVAVLRSV